MWQVILIAAAGLIVLALLLLTLASLWLLWRTHRRQRRGHTPWTNPHTHIEEGPHHDRH